MAQRSLEQTVCSVPFLVDKLIETADELVGAETSLKRFWKNVDITQVENGLMVALDNRPLKTPSGNKLQLPQNKRMLAVLVATEWENQDKVLKTHALPMVGVSVPVGHHLAYINVLS
jgi:chaperone required for assembly of F1-ATPase